MKEIILAALGGACGAAARYIVGLLTARRTGKTYLATLTVNLSGSFLLGLLQGLSIYSSMSMTLTFVGIGVLGGFTTYSTLMVQSVTMAQDKAFRTLFSYLAFTYACGLLLCGIGLVIGKLIKIGV